MKLIEKDTFGDDINIAHLTDRINYQEAAILESISWLAIKA